eukprot:13837601-Ditylum_brightwellii.AAC.1
MEINLDTMCQNITRIIQDTARKHFSHSKITTASLCIPVKHFFDLGGTLSIIQGDVVGRIIDSGSDEYGQWVYTKIAAKDERVVT